MRQHARLTRVTLVLFRLRHLIYAQFVVNQAGLLTDLVLSRLDYCNAILVDTSDVVENPLHVVVRTVLDIKPRDHITPALRQLRWLSMAERVVSVGRLQAPQYIVNLSHLFSVINVIS